MFESANLHIWIYFLFLIVSVTFSVLINGLFLKFSGNLGMRDVKSEFIRWSSTSKPSFGGISFYILFLLSVAVLGVLFSDLSYRPSKEILAIVSACTLGFIVGLSDDAYNTVPIVKFIGQFTCANILIYMGIKINISPNDAVNYFFTLLWVIGLMNSINMLDNMDGITTMVSICIIFGALVVMYFNVSMDEEVYGMMLLGVLGALIGFLIFNWHPSKMYMGDTGSQFLGVFLSVISIRFFWNEMRDYTTEAPSLQIRQFVIPMLLFIVPLIDTITVVIRRIARGQSPFVGGRDHITHNLAYLGLSDRSVAIVLGLLSLASIAIVTLVMHLIKAELYQTFYTIIFFGYFLLVFIIIQIFYNKAQRKMKTTVPSQ